MTTLPIPVAPALSFFAEAADYASQALSPATLRAYGADWRSFVTWCRLAELPPLPAAPQTVAAYLASMAGTRSRATIERRLVSIGQAHKLAGHDWRAAHPAIRATLRGMFRRHGRPQLKAAALGRDEVVMLLDVCTDGQVGVRDRAMFLLGFAAALRRSELVAVRREHLTFRPDGVRLFLPRSKTDALNEGVELGIAHGANPATCPVLALKRWIDAVDCQSGPLFRMIRANGELSDRPLHPSSVRFILRRRAEQAKLEVGALERLSPHGLRAGFVTEAYKAGARDEEIMDHSRHKDLRTMRGYVRRAKLMGDSPVKRLGL